MDYRQCYRHFVAEEIAYLPDKQQLVGRFREQIRPLDSIPNALEWFVALSQFEVKSVGKFLSKYGLLRWNWTHAGWTGDQSSTSSQFYFSIRDFRDSHHEFQKHWILASKRGRNNRATVCEWLCEQLAPRSKDVAASQWPEMWKLTQPRLAMRVEAGAKSGIAVQLIAGDLWQALCWALLENLTEENGLIRVCKNPLCKGQKYFVGRAKYCDPRCGKLVADRKSARKIRRQKKRRG